MYFPISENPLEMKASLKSHPADYGNGSYDNLYFQFDIHKDRYIKFKLANNPSRYGVIEESLPIHTAVLSWCKDKLSSEQGIYCGGVSSYRDLSNRVQEDFAVVTEDDKVVASYVSFPSNWSPENILGLSFSEVHRAVPKFPRDGRESLAMVNAMVKKGPYVRFVWTVTPDANLDHHPKLGSFGSWDSCSEGYLRVERQLTVPFPNEGGALFLVRTYLTPFSQLNSSESGTLVKALVSLPEEVSSYKGISNKVVDKAIFLLNNGT
jgi:hypothetical protein